MSSLVDGIRVALPGYDIGGEVGSGGCGVVLSGVHRRLQRRVAIKQIPPQFASDPSVRARFATEARLLAGIDHSHVVSIYDYVQNDDVCLLVMEYLPGGTIESRFMAEGFDLPTTLAISLSCAAGLQSAHSRGVLHRDIKPSNLMFAANGSVKITDFGIAQIVGGADTLATRNGEIVGTPSYIAPEQARGLELSAATDVYALATMTYQLLSGRLPFPSGDDSQAVLYLHAFEKPTPLSSVAPSVPGPIADVVMRGLATDPGDRFDSAESFGVSLATLAAESLGTDWLGPVGIPVTGSEAIVSAAAGNGSSGRRAQRTAVRSALVRPTEPISRSHIGLADLQRRDVGPVQQVLKFRSPWLPRAVALVLGGIAVLITIFGALPPARTGDLPPGALTIAGVDPASGEVSGVDLSHPIPIAVADPNAGEVALVIELIGMPVGHSEMAWKEAPGDTVASPINPYLMAGDLTAVVTVRHHDRSATHHRFVLGSSNNRYLTAFTGATVFVALFAIAYLESSLRSLRRGATEIGRGLTAACSAAALAVAAAAATWLAAGREPAPTVLATATACAAAAGIAASVAAARTGRRRRYRRALRRMALLKTGSGARV